MNYVEDFGAIVKNTVKYVSTRIFFFFFFCISGQDYPLTFNQCLYCDSFKLAGYFK